ncbi:hypothetical protein [Microcystis phage Mae-JY04]|uniref:hypothetical protein n=1 Tax=Blastomonas sp. TaxID=1909299 RepID=UPI00258F8E57|nr:hypothetical protein [Blastomonas sp.]
MNGISDDTPGLFGWVPAPPRGQGRPAFTWSREKSNRIMVLFASGYQQGDVAAVIGCDVKTLRKVFPVECREQRRAGLVLRSGMMARLLDEAEKGNVAACKELDRLVAAEQARAIDARIGKPDRKAEKKPAPQGKKEQQQDAAQGVGGLFGTRKPPPAALIN